MICNTNKRSMQVEGSAQEQPTKASEVESKKAKCDSHHGKMSIEKSMDGSIALKSSETQYIVMLKAADPTYSAAFLPAPSPQQADEAEQDKDSNNASAPYEVHFVDVLQFEVLNQVALGQALDSIDTTFCGVLLTSPRAAQAIAQLIQSKQAEQRAQLIGKLQRSRFFAVGKATAKELDAFGIYCEGQETGSADQMAGFLAECDLQDDGKPMLFVCGEKHHDALPESFAKRNKPLQKLVVYRSCPVEKVEFPAFGRTVAAPAPHWVVFFSPSGLKVVQALNLPWKHIKKAAIGQTTAKAMRSFADSQEKPEWNADVVASKPTPEALALAIRQFDAQASNASVRP